MNSLPRRAAGKVRRKLKAVSRNLIAKDTKPITYKQWIEKCEPKLWAEVEKSQKLKVSVVVPAYNTPDKYLKPLIQSLVDQTYENWELCLVDASSDKTRSAAIKEIAESDKRIVYIPWPKNDGIAANTNAGLKKASGDYIGFLDHDDTLAPQAINEVVAAIKAEKADLIYSDEDKLSDDGKVRSIPFFKPGWSPELINSVNYLAHFVVVKRSLIESVNWLRTGFDGAQDYDFILRASGKADKIYHIPKMLYHWRLADGSTAKGAGEKNYADDAGQKALMDALKRQKIDAEVIGIPGQPTNYRVKYNLPSKKPKVSIIIPFKDKPDLLRQCVDSILKLTTYENYEIILVSNNSVDQETHDLLAEYKKQSKCRIYIWDHPFNFSAVNNFGAKKATGEYIILLNNDTKVITPEWIEELVGVASQKDVGAVGPLLYYPNKTIQHAGVALGMGTMAGHVFRHRLKNEWTDFGITSWPRNYLAVTGACLVVNKKKYFEVGGLDEKIIIAGSDVTLCLSLYEMGYKNVYWPFAELIHYENVSVGSYSNVPPTDYDRSLERYRKYLNYKDINFNINLDLMDESVSIRGKYDE